MGLDATSSPTATQSQTAFTLRSIDITASYSINADLAGQDFNFGILKLSIPVGDAVTLAQDLSLSVVRSLAVGGATLATIAADITAGTLDALEGDAPFLTHEITAQTEGPELLDVPVSLLDLHAIDGISPFSDGRIVISGHASGTDMTVDLGGLTDALRTATGSPDLDLLGFNNFLMKDLIGRIGSLNTYISDLATKSAELNIDLPFLQDTPLGPLLDTGLAFKHEVIDPLANPALMLGFSEGGSSKAGETWLTGEDIAADDLAALPADLGLKITLDNGLQAELHFTPTYVDDNGDTQQVATLEDLATAINQAIDAGAAAGWVSASVSGAAIRLSIVGSHGERQPERISISSPDVATDIRAFGISLARLLHLEGWNDNTSSVLDYGDNLLARLGMAYDGEHNGITLTISKEIRLAEVVAPFAVDFSLGDLAGLSLSNAQFHLDTSVLLSLTLGYSLDPLGSDLNQPDGPQVGDGLNGTPDTALQDLPAYVLAAGKSGAIPLTANQVADAAGEAGDPAHTGLKDIQIIGREGAVLQLEFLPDAMLSNLEQQIYNGFGRNMTLTLDPLTSALTLRDVEPAYDGPAATALGLTVGSAATAVQDAGNPNDYAATLAGVAPADGAAFGDSSAFILTLGKLPPVVVQVGSGTNTVDSYVNRLNNALHDIDVDPADIGLPDGTTVTYWDLVRASRDTDGGVALSTRVYDELKFELSSAAGRPTEPFTSIQRVAIQSSIRVDEVQLMVTALHGSLLPGLFGLVGSDPGGQAAEASTLVGVPLHGETLSDRFYLQDTGISALVTASLEPEDPTQDLVLAGTFGAFEFTAKLYDAANPSDDMQFENYLSLKLSLFLNTPGEDPGGHITLHELQDALGEHEFLKIWSFNLASGVEDGPFAQLSIKDIHLAVGAVDLTSAAAPEITVSVEGIENLLEHKAPEVHLEVTGLSKSLVAADLLGALQQTFDNLNSDFMQAELPLVQVSLDDILGFGQTFLLALDAAQQDPDGTLSAVQDAINGVLGADVLTLSIDANKQLIATLHWAPVAVTEELPFSLDFSALDSFLGGNAAIAAIADALGAVGSLSAGGTLAVTAGVDLALTLGFDMAGEGTPALLTSPLQSLNGGKGIRADANGRDDLEFTLGNGHSFSINLSQLGSRATIEELLEAINTAAGIADFAQFDATTGTLSFTDSTTSTASGLDALGFTEGEQAGDFGKVNKLVGNALDSEDYAKAWSFTLNIGNNVHADIELEADAERTSGSGFINALRAVLNTTMVSGKALLAENAHPPGQPEDPDADYAVALGQLVKVYRDINDHIVFSATDGVLGTDTAGNLLNQFSISHGAPELTLKVQALHGTSIIQDLGLGEGSEASISDSGARVLTTKLMQPDTFGQRLYIETGCDPDTGNLLTGVSAHLGITASDLNFTAALGPFGVTIANGSATLAEDTGLAEAGSPGFEVGDALEKPAYVLIGLDDGFGGGASGDGRITFRDLSHLGETGSKLADLLRVEANAAVDVSLPAYVFGAPIGDLTLQIGNLFDTTQVDEMPARSVSIQTPDVSELSLSDILNDPQTLINGLDAFLGTLSGPLAQKIYGLNIPLAGPALQGIGAFFTTLHTDVVETLQGLLDDFKASHPGQAATTQGIVTQGLEEVLHLMGLPGDVYSFIDDLAHPTEIAFIWQFDTTLLDTTVNLSSDLGIPGLGLSIADGQADLNVALTATLGFGFKKDSGFFVYDMGTSSALGSFVSNDDPDHVFSADFSTMHALDLAVALQLAPTFQASLNLGFLTVQATNGTMLTAESHVGTLTGTSLSGSIYVDVGPRDHDGRLLFSEFSKGPPIRAAVDLQLNLDLMLDAGLGVGSVSMALPAVRTELTFGYEFARTLYGGVGDEPISHVTAPVTFNHVTLDVGSFLTNVMLPILDKLETVLGPLQPIIEFLQTPIPGLSAILGPTSIIDLAQRFSPSPAVQSAVKFLNLVDDINTLYHTLQDNAGSNLGLDFGTFVLGPTSDPDAESISATTVDPFATKISKTDLSAAKQNLANDPAANAAAAGKLEETSASGNASGSKLKKLMAAGIIELPLLQDPLATLQLLLGDPTPVDLVKVHLPEFSFSFSSSISIRFMVGPVPVEVSIYAAAGVTFNLGFGYDSKGIQQFISDHKPQDLFDGFYVDNTIGPQMIFWAKFGLTGAVNLTLIKAGLGGEIGGTVAFTLSDPNHDGKVRFSEFLYELTHEPLHMFVIDGSINLRIYAFVWVGIDLWIKTITLFEASFDIVNVTLLSFHYDYAAAHSTPHLASLEDDGALTLNMGENADQQEVGGNIANPNQEMHLSSSGAGQVTVTQPGTAPQSYSGVDLITANLGDGDNKIDFTSPVFNEVHVTAGDGNNVIDLGNVYADPLITFGNGDNMASGAPIAPNTVRGGNGNNVYRGGNAGDDVELGDGNNLIVGGAGDDLIVVGGGNNTIYGGGGNDTIIAASGDNIIYGGDGDDHISIQGAGRNLIFGQGPNHDETAGGTTVSTTLLAATPADATAGNNVIDAGDGQDTIFGGAGDNSITGGAGDSVIFGSFGQVVRDSAGGIISMSASQAVGGNNTIAGGSGDEVIFGGAGNHSISGGAGTDIILAGTGAVDGAVGGSGGLFSATSSSLGGGASTVAGGSGNDVILGGIGADSLEGGAGADIISGDLAAVVRDAPLAGGTLSSAQTILHAQGGADTVAGNDGNDVILGGRGADSVDAGSATDVVLGDFGSVTAENLGTNATVLGTDAGTADNGNDSITASAIIMGGGGNNTIITTEALSPANGSTPAVRPQDRTEVVFGAVGQVTMDYAVLGGFTLHQAGNVEEAHGGDNSITVGDGNNAVFGGPGAATIRSGSGDLTNGIGNTVVLGHFGDITWTEANTKLTVASRDGDPAGFRHGNDTIDGHGNTVVIGGGGDNRITTHDAISPSHPAGDWTEVVFGGNGNANLGYNANGRIILLQGWTRPGEENFGGDNTITLGDADGIVIGGAGTQHITAGNGSNILLGHLGSVDFSRQAAPDGSGKTPDILSFTAPQDGSTQPTLAAFITAGDGHNIIMGGSGDNVITAGAGNNLIFGASGAVTRDAAGGLLKALTVEERLGGTESITAGSGNNTVFGGAGTTGITVGDGDNLVLGHIGTFTKPDGEVLDVLGRATTLYGTLQPFALHTPTQVLTTVATILAGHGNNIILGTGAGDNVITAGDGNNLILGAAGAVRRDAGLGLLQAFTVEETRGGNERITAGDGRNTVFGGGGTNGITVGDGDNVVLGHIGTFTKPDGLVADIVGRVTTLYGIMEPFAPETPTQVLTTTATIRAGNGNNIILGTSAGDNAITAGGGNNLIFGAAGVVRRDAGLTLLQAYTVEETRGGNDSISAGDGSNTIFGGAGNNVIRAGHGNNVVLGHIGTFTRMDGINPDVVGRDTTQYGIYLPYEAPAPQQRLITHAYITLGDGDNVVMGSSAGNNGISAGIVDNIIFGAAGQVTRKPASGAAGAFTPLRAETVEEEFSGDNLILVGRDGEGFGSQNVVFGGFGANTIVGGDGDNKVFGHAGLFTWWPNGQPQEMYSRAWTYGRDVLITVGNGNNDVLGGKGSNSIIGGNGHNVLMSDQGLVRWNDDGTRLYAESQKDPGFAGNSTVRGGNGNNDIIGGPNWDLLIGGDGTNIIIGYNGQIFFDHGVEIRAQTYAGTIGDRHTLVGGAGRDFLIGGTMGNDFVADPLNDLIYPEQGMFTRSDRIARWEQPPFFISAATNPIFNWFYTPAYRDALAGDGHTTMGGDPLLLAYNSAAQPLLFSTEPPPGGVWSMPLTGGAGVVPGYAVLLNGPLWLVSPEAGGRVVAVTGIGLSAQNTVLTPMWDWLPGEAGGAVTPLQAQASAETAVPTPTYLVEGDQTLPGGLDLAALAARVAARRLGEPQAWVLDEASGRWQRDEAPAGPQLVLEDAPHLILGPAAGKTAAA